jgi:hypothetical protein
MPALRYEIEKAKFITDRAPYVGAVIVGLTIIFDCYKSCKVSLGNTERIGFSLQDFEKVSAQFLITLSAFSRGLNKIPYMEFTTNKTLERIEYSFEVVATSREITEILSEINSLEAQISTMLEKWKTIFSENSNKFSRTQKVNSLFWVRESSFSNIVPQSSFPKKQSSFPVGATNSIYFASSRRRF